MVWEEGGGLINDFAMEGSEGGLACMQTRGWMRTVINGKCLGEEGKVKVGARAGSSSGEEALHQKGLADPRSPTGEGRERERERGRERARERKRREREKKEDREP